MSDDASVPVAVISLDTRSWGPLYCDNCDRDDESEGQEELVLMSNGDFCCVTCKTPIGGYIFEAVSGAIVSAKPYLPPERGS